MKVGDLGELVRRQGPAEARSRSSPASRSTRTPASTSSTRFEVPPAQLDGLEARRRKGAIVGDAAREEARLEGRRQGHRSTADIYPGRLGVQDRRHLHAAAQAPPIATRFIFHWDYLNNDPRGARQGPDRLDRRAHRRSGATPPTSPRRIDNVRRARRPDPDDERARVPALVPRRLLRDPQGARHRVDRDPRSS